MFSYPMYAFLWPTSTHWRSSIGTRQSTLNGSRLRLTPVDRISELVADTLTSALEVIRELWDSIS